ncbi:hypothetical protein P0136_07430 [Lentisphaerota bacterium ZTH]|nr:hypothetical protein JYG24_01455 [Lentisphaerota bacterium]WET05200.1 hypothetical protein P0136_07430 [Lentisphaerota bacterium ZTH]
MGQIKVKTLLICVSTLKAFTSSVEGLPLVLEELPRKSITIYFCIKTIKSGFLFFCKTFIWTLCSCLPERCKYESKVF